jgi:hypothetical protein
MAESYPVMNVIISCVEPSGLRLDIYFRSVYQKIIYLLRTRCLVLVTEKCVCVLDF